MDIGPAPNREPLGSLLRGLRERRGVGLTDAARRAGLGRTTLYQWETDARVPRGPALERLLDALEAPERLRSEAIVRADPRHAQFTLAQRPLGRPVGLGQVLRAMRLRRGMTQSEAARASGVSQGAFARWEGGDDAPAASTLHAVGFALGASPEEAAALSLAQGGGSDAPRTPEEAVYASIAVRTGQESLHEVLQLGIEADAWRRSMRDSRWDVAVTSAMAKRALRYFYDERFAEAEAVAAEAVMALEVLERLGRWRGDAPGRIVRVAEAWAASIPMGPTPEGGSKVWAAKIGARARAATGDLAGAMEAARPFPEWLAKEYSGHQLEHMIRWEMADLLIAGRAPQRALDLLRPDEPGVGNRIIDTGILIANREPVPEAWRETLRAALPGVHPETARTISGFEHDPEKRPAALRLSC